MHNGLKTIERELFGFSAEWCGGSVAPLPKITTFRLQFRRTFDEFTTSDIRVDVRYAWA